MRVGVFQCASGGLSTDERLNRLENAMVSNHSGEHLDLVLCSELFTSGYNVGDDLRATAEAPQGETFDKISAISKKLNVAIAYGYPEQGDHCLYNSAALISSSGELIANHRKQLNSPGSFEEDYFVPGNTPTYFTYGGLKIAILICYEVEFPESVRNAAVNGVHLVLVPTALVAQWSVVAHQVVPTRAFENGIWLAYANHAGHENGFDYLGGSKIVAPDGKIEAEAGYSEELIMTEIEINRVRYAQKRLPYLRDYKKYS
ncbi:MAG: putative amidohydrolase [Gammaproteobacteria bacterium]|jgi:predicted amidohydrolase